jgi:hypothetical protein
MFARRKARTGLQHCALLLCVANLAACKHKTNEASCPRIDELSAEPSVLEPGTEASRISVRVSDPDEDSQRRIATMLLSEHGTFDDESARETMFHCGPEATGTVEICVEARFEGDEKGTDGGLSDASLASQHGESDRAGDSANDGGSCTQSECIELQCPQNECPVIERFQLEETPTLAEATVFVEVRDVDGKPMDVTTTLSASSGSFDDVHASEATYTCEPFAPNPIEICVLVSDGDPACEQRKCGEVDCNLCPSLYSLSVIAVGANRAEVQIRAEDLDDFPAPLVTQLTASSGSFEDPQASDTFYLCDGAGPVEICVEVSDQDCSKTACTQLGCP